MVKECTRPHSLAHMLEGAGIALLVLYLLPTLMPYLLVMGLICLVGGALWDFSTFQEKK